jgi:hypothetical protein
MMNQERAFKILDEAYDKGWMCVALEPDKQNSVHLNRWCKDSGVRAYGRKHSGSYFVTFETREVDYCIQRTMKQGE